MDGWMDGDISVRELDTVGNLIREILIKLCAMIMMDGVLHMCVSFSSLGGRNDLFIWNVPCQRVVIKTSFVRLSRAGRQAGRQAGGQPSPEQRQERIKNATAISECKDHIHKERAGAGTKTSIYKPAGDWRTHQPSANRLSDPIRKMDPVRKNNNCMYVCMHRRTKNDITPYCRICLPACVVDRSTVTEHDGSIRRNQAYSPVFHSHGGATN
ncbi:hypothetical protein T310_3547 [Rasamsonia emersonii CBS 393.64]|uniref:Uncharacterized protein n=1 Tax=Rasamsonia emersonii (strain ATCC 16479 / CBS 393.64 / IMI 116815) TaxID=1408163 RepID=A0A0F4YXV9_RASE3|nr:hypothetical protein T310_3547 [Rasamsonia emersonii CBS 393.64]KKA22468.1 hypothetical protein T310_3547 [Rasamsonia emersonii CBS 393.64]